MGGYLRPFWLSADIEGRKSGVGTGPRSKSGGMDVSLAANVDGESVEFLSVHCWRDFQGKLSAHIDVQRTHELHTRITWKEDDGVRRTDADKTREQTLAELLMRIRGGGGPRMPDIPQGDYTHAAEDLIVEVLQSVVTRHGMKAASDVIAGVMEQAKKFNV